MKVVVVTLDEAKTYLRVDTNEEDELITTLMNAAQKECMDVARFDDETEFDSAGDIAKIAVLYTLATFYENRENYDHTALTLRLRSLLGGIRQEVF